MAVLLPVLAGGPRPSRPSDGDRKARQSGNPAPKGWNTEEDGSSPVCCSARRRKAAEQQTGMSAVAGSGAEGQVRPLGQARMGWSS